LCTQAIQSALKEKEIILIAKSIGRQDTLITLSQGERNTLEGRFEQAKQVID
jgi:hypothetical protein